MISIKTDLDDFLLFLKQQRVLSIEKLNEMYKKYFEKLVQLELQLGLPKEKINELIQSTKENQKEQLKQLDDIYNKHIRYFEGLKKQIMQIDEIDEKLFKSQL